MAKCDMCGSRYSPMNCYTESGECVDPLTNYDIKLNNDYILKPNHNLFMCFVIDAHKIIQILL